MIAAQLIEQIEHWRDDQDGGAMKSLELILDLLRLSGRPFSRDQLAPGHITATALVLSERSDAVLLVHHQRLVEQCLQALEAAHHAVNQRVPHEMLLLDLYASLRFLDEITGPTTTDDILNLIFGTFCIGK